MVSHVRDPSFLGAHGDGSTGPRPRATELASPSEYGRRVSRDRRKGRRRAADQTNPRATSSNAVIEQRSLRFRGGLDFQPIWSSGGANPRSSGYEPTSRDKPSLSGREHGDPVVTGSAREACVVCHQRVESLHGEQPERSCEMDGVERCDGRGRDGFGRGENSVVRRQQRNSAEQAVGVGEQTFMHCKTTEFYAEKPARDSLLKSPQPVEHGRCIRLAEKDAAQSARVEIHRRQELSLRDSLASPRAERQSFPRAGMVT